MLSSDIHVLSHEKTDQLLNRLQEWRNGICPDGNLAVESCFVLGRKPSVHIYPDQILPAQRMLATPIITEWEWAENLIACGAISHVEDDLMLRTMSEFFKIFHASTDKRKNQNTLHLIQSIQYAFVKIDNLARPTAALSSKILAVLSEPDATVQWIQLVDLWNTFGYLWPRKLILGHKTHHSQSYTFAGHSESIQAFHQNLDSMRKKQYPAAIPDFDMDQFLNNAVIISRLELIPLHEFLDTETKQAINNIINAKFVQIPVSRPIKIYSEETHSYLCWGPGTAKQHPGENPDYLIRAVSAEPIELNKLPETQYLWRLEWSPAVANDSEAVDPVNHRSQTIRGSDQVYIYPACQSKYPAYPSDLVQSNRTRTSQINDRMSQDSAFVHTHKMPLGCRPHRENDLPILKGLQLLSSDPRHDVNEKNRWTVQYPNNGLKYMKDSQVDIKLNFHEHIRRVQPVLDGDTIQLQQIGLLTTFRSMSNPEDYPMQDSNPQRSRTAKKTVESHPSIKSKNMTNVMCVDENIINKRFQENTRWKIQLATPFDKKRHSSNFYRWPAKNDHQQYGCPKEYHEMHSQEIRNHMALHLSTASATYSLKRSKSLESLHDKPNSDKAHYYEDLLTSNLLSEFAKKVSLQPLAQLMKSLRPRAYPSNNHRNPPHHS